MALTSDEHGKRAELRRLTSEMVNRGIVLASGALIDTRPSALSMLRTLADARSNCVRDKIGNLHAADPYEILVAANQYVSDCFRHSQELSEAILKDPDTDLSQGWPDNRISTGDNLWPYQQSPAFTAPARLRCRS